MYLAAVREREREAAAQPPLDGAAPSLASHLEMVSVGGEKKDKKDGSSAHPSGMGSVEALRDCAKSEDQLPGPKSDP